MRNEPVHTKVSPFSGAAMQQMTGLENWAEAGPSAQPRTPTVVGGVVRERTGMGHFVSHTPAKPV